MLTGLKYWLSDFLPYSIESWAGLLEHYNQTWWPFSLVVLPLTIAIFRLSHHRSLLQRRIALWLLAIGWLWSGLVFLRLNFATLNWSGNYVSWLFVVQAVLLVIYSNTDQFQTAAISRKLKARNYIVLMIALGALPLIQLLSGYQHNQLSWFALTPDPTVLTTFALLGAIHFLPKGLILIPLVWGIVVFANSWPLNDFAGMAVLPLSVFLLLVSKRL